MHIHILHEVHVSNTTYLYDSKPVLNRCVPLKGEGLQGVLYNLYGYLNTMDVLEQVLADLYASWHLILIFIFITLGESKSHFLLWSMYFFFILHDTSLILPSVALSSWSNGLYAQLTIYRLGFRSSVGQLLTSSVAALHSLLCIH